MTSRLSQAFPLREPADPTTEFEVENILTVPPFSRSQVQCVLWLSWTTTASSTHIAKMTNRAFSDSRIKLSHWNVLDIENDVATIWHERGRSFSGMEPMSLLVPPGDDNPWSCLCDFGVPNCYDFKRDKENGENLEKLSMARMLWDATPKQMVRCPHGRRRTRDQDGSVQRSTPKALDLEPVVPVWLMNTVKVLASLVILLAVMIALYKSHNERKIV
jgi:hypothetical protein